MNLPILLTVDCPHNQERVIFKNCLHCPHCDGYYADVVDCGYKKGKE